MDHETLVRSALEADADTAPTGAGMLVLARRRAAVRRVRVRAAGAFAVVAGLAGVAGAATLLPLSSARSLPPSTATASVSIPPTPTGTPAPTPTPGPTPTATPRTTVAGLVGVPRFAPPESLVPGYLPAGFAVSPRMWQVNGADTSGEWWGPDHVARLGIAVGPGPAQPKPQPGTDEPLTWRPTTVAGRPGQQAAGREGTYLRWRTADGRLAALYLGSLNPRKRPAAAEAHRVADGLKPGVPDWRPKLQPTLMPAGWETTGVFGNLYRFALKGREEPRITIVVIEPMSVYPRRLGGLPAALEEDKDGTIVLRLKVDARHEVTVYAYGNPHRPSRKQVEAIALGVELPPAG